MVNGVLAVLSNGNVDNEEFIVYTGNKDNEHKGKLRFFGGRLETNETYQKTLKRELDEEINAIIENIVLLQLKKGSGGVDKVYLCSGTITNISETYDKEDKFGSRYWTKATELFKSNLFNNDFNE